MRRYSPQNGTERAAIPLPSPSARSVVVAFGSVWVAGTTGVELYRIDPATNQIIATIDLHARPVALSSGEGSVWVRQIDGTVQRIDGHSGTLLATFATDAADNMGNIAVGGGFVWVNSNSAPLLQIDPRTNSQRPRYASPTGEFMGYTIAYGGGSLGSGGPPYSGSNRPNKVSGGRRGSFTPDSAKKLPSARAEPESGRGAQEIARANRQNLCAEALDFGDGPGASLHDANRTSACWSGLRPRRVVTCGRSRRRECLLWPSRLSKAAIPVAAMKRC